MGMLTYGLVEMQNPHKYMDICGYVGNYAAQPDAKHRSAAAWRVSSATCCAQHGARYMLPVARSLLFFPVPCCIDACVWYGGTLHVVLHAITLTITIARTEMARAGRELAEELHRCERREHVRRAQRASRSQRLLRRATQRHFASSRVRRWLRGWHC